MFNVEWSRKALKQLLKVRQEDRQRITDATRALSAWPECRNVKALENHTYGYRLRAGRYRVFFDVETAIRIVRIEEVKKRDERTY